MAIAQVDFAIRLSGGGILLLLAGLLLRDRRQLGLSTFLFGSLAICLAGFVLGNTPLLPFGLTGLSGEIASAASGMTVIFLWWFSLSCFDSRFRLNGHCRVPSGFLFINVSDIQPLRENQAG